MSRAFYIGSHRDGERVIGKCRFSSNLRFPRATSEKGAADNRHCWTLTVDGRSSETQVPKLFLRKVGDIRLGRVFSGGRTKNTKDVVLNWDTFTIVIVNTIVCICSASISESVKAGHPEFTGRLCGSVIHWAFFLRLVCFLLCAFLKSVGRLCAVFLG